MEKDKVRDGVRQVLIDYLERNEMRKTPERFAILDAIYTMTGHFTQEQLRRSMDEGLDYSNATFYNNLDLFQKIGLIHRHDVGSVPQYERALYVDAHYHYVCEQCSEMIEVKDALLLNIIQSRRMKRFHPSHYLLYIYGLCAKCKTALSKSAQKKKQK